ALESLGVRSVWRIAVKPGRPLCVGQIGESIVVGLPGNTVAVAVCAMMYLWPMLGVLGGGDWRTPVRIPLRANFAHPKRKTGRREYWRARRVTGPDGATWVEKFARDGSGLISSLTFADGLIEITEDMGGVAHGDTVQFIPFSAYGMAESV
ncbi:MAG: molybdopterin molybdenumtransferase MoeA, partial [Pseudomonadota bacterium]